MDIFTVWLRVQSLDTPPFNQPLIAPAKPLPFEQRLRLIAKQVLQYRHMYRVDPVIEKLALDLAG